MAGAERCGVQDGAARPGAFHSSDPTGKSGLIMGVSYRRGAQEKTSATTLPNHPDDPVM